MLFVFINLTFLQTLFVISNLILAYVGLGVGLGLELSLWLGLGLELELELDLELELELELEIEIDVKPELEEFFYVNGLRLHRLAKQVP